MKLSVGLGARRMGMAWLAILGCTVLLIGLTFQELEDVQPDPDGRTEEVAELEEIEPDLGEETTAADNGEPEDGEPMAEAPAPDEGDPEIVVPAEEEVPAPTEPSPTATPLPTSEGMPPAATPTPEGGAPELTASPTPTRGTPTPVPPVISTPATRTPTSVVQGNPPTAPASVIVRSIAQGTIVLEWTDSSDNELGFRIDVSGPTVLSRTVASNTTEHHIGGLRTGTYCFILVAFNGDGESPPLSVCIGVR